MNLCPQPDICRARSCWICEPDDLPDSPDDDQDNDEEASDE